MTFGPWAIMRMLTNSTCLLLNQNTKVLKVSLLYSRRDVSYERSDQKKLTRCSSLGK